MSSGCGCEKCKDDIGHKEWYGLKALLQSKPECYCACHGVPIGRSMGTVGGEKFNLPDPKESESRL